ncbi:MAG: threonyl-tRNA synthetase [Candidatus Parcubacteria bacterium]|jgi:threonyl-tRNA synthetase
MAAIKPADFTPLDTLRHSAAHVFAAAVMQAFPEAKLGVGPVIENGFYYDLDISRPLQPLDLQKLEARMAKIVQRNAPFVREELPIDDAIKMFKDMKQDYKVELLEAIKTKGTTAVVSDEESGDVEAGKDTASIYRTGDFVDLCRGPHVESAGKIGAFKLKSIAGAYWRGDQKNKQMQRVYGLAFATKADLEAYLKMAEEAEKRDHKKLGPELDLFVFSDLVGPGLPLFTPRGTFIRHKLDAFVWEMRQAKGYERVEIPHITKKALYEKSGHWEKYQDDLFKIVTREKHEFAMKPMNCPHHTQIYARKQWSYRELPQRYANTTFCYRDEQSGELAGLSRVRGFTQDDAHVFCRMDDVKKEMLVVYDIIEKFYKTFGLSLKLRLSLHDPKHPEKVLGDKEGWKKAEDALRAIAASKKLEYFEAPGEAAIYGPKLDFMAVDSIGRSWQVATVQLDMIQPERFDLTCVNEAGEKERIVMIHAAIMGSIERFMSVLIEHVAGAFPVWLAPTQVQIAPVGKEHAKIAKKLCDLLNKEGIRAAWDDSRDTVGYKIRKAEKMRVPYMLVVGDKEKSLKTLMVRIRSVDKEKKMALKAFIKMVKDNDAKKKLLA